MYLVCNVSKPEPHRPRKTVYTECSPYAGAQVPMEVSVKISHLVISCGFLDKC